MKLNIPIKNHRSTIHCERKKTQWPTSPYSFDLGLQYFTVVKLSIWKFFPAILKSPKFLYPWYFWEWERIWQNSERNMKNPWKSTINSLISQSIILFFCIYLSASECFFKTFYCKKRTYQSVRWNNLKIQK